MNDLRRLDLNLLSTLAAMYEERTVSRVAAKLKVSQPTVSYSLAKLRTFFNDELFVRASGAMLPTARAEALREPVARMMQILSDDILPEGEFIPAASRRRFTISTSDIGELVFLPPLLEAIAQQAPHASINSVSMPAEKLQAVMAQGDADLAIGYFPDFSGGAFFEQKLFDHPFACMVRRDHPTISDDLSLEQFLSADHAVVLQEGRSQEILERALAAAGLSRRVLLQSQHFMTLPLIVAQTDMVLTVPRAVALAYSHMASLKILDPPIAIAPVELKQYWHRRVHADPAVRWLRRLAMSLFLNRDPSLEPSSRIFRPHRQYQ